MLPNGVPIQPQMGIFPQNVAALNGLMSQLSNAPNHLLALQCNQLALQQLMGFGSQNNAQALNAVPGQFFNMGQSSNPLNMFQALTGNMFLPNSHFCMPNPMQNVNQLLSMQMSNSSQVPRHNGPLFPNPAMGSDGLRQQINQSQQKLICSEIGANGIGPLAVTSQQPQENNAATVNLHPDQAEASPGIVPSTCNKFQVAYILAFVFSIQFILEGHLPCQSNHVLVNFGQKSFVPFVPSPPLSVIIVGSIFISSCLQWFPEIRHPPTSLLSFSCRRLYLTVMQAKCTLWWFA